jgi:hypothetical protein
MVIERHGSQRVASNLKQQTRGTGILFQPRVRGKRFAVRAVGGYRDLLQHGAARPQILRRCRSQSRRGATRRRRG